MTATPARLRLLSANIQAGNSTRSYREYITRSWSHVLPAGKRDSLVEIARVAEPFDISLAAISKHLGILAEAGLISREKRGRVIWCKLEPDALRALGDGHASACHKAAWHRAPPPIWCCLTRTRPICWIALPCSRNRRTRRLTAPGWRVRCWQPMSLATRYMRRAECPRLSPLRSC